MLHELSVRDLGVVDRLRLTFSSSPRGPKSYYGFEESRSIPEAVKARAAAALRATTQLHATKAVAP